VSEHLKILRSVFPKQVMLDVNDIAKCLNVTAGTIYNLNSTGQLPFKCRIGISNRLQVSIVELARYLDEELSKP
jgi:hypothetical protein